ncbi:MAG: hypothetical protein M1821_009549 [Bathelium mastoideum]|nr:MAG: hypothetical protein M1821_009549 [Bathelium mastoideum]
MDESSSPATSMQTTPLTFSEGDAELVLVAAHLVESNYGRILLQPSSNDADRAAAAARVMGALMHLHITDGHCVDTARTIIDHVHGRSAVADAFGEGPLMIFSMSYEEESREWERIDSEWESRIHRFVSEAKILKMAEIGRELMTRLGGLGSGARNGETERQRERREEEEERRRLELGKALYLRAREVEFFNEK